MSLISMVNAKERERERERECVCGYMSSALQAWPLDDIVDYWPVQKRAMSIKSRRHYCTYVLLPTRRVGVSDEST